MTQHREKIEIDFSILKDVDIDCYINLYELYPIKEKERKKYYFTYQLHHFINLFRANAILMIYKNNKESIEIKIKK